MNLVQYNVILELSLDKFFKAFDFHLLQKGFEKVKRW